MYFCHLKNKNSPDSSLETHTHDASMGRRYIYQEIYHKNQLFMDK